MHVQNLSRHHYFVTVSKKPIKRVWMQGGQQSDNGGALVRAVVRRDASMPQAWLSFDKALLSVDGFFAKELMMKLHIAQLSLSKALQTKVLSYSALLFSLRQPLYILGNSDMNRLLMRCLKPHLIYALLPYNICLHNDYNPYFFFSTGQPHHPSDSDNLASLSVIFLYPHILNHA